MALQNSLSLLVPKVNKIKIKGLFQHTTQKKQRHKRQSKKIKNRLKPLCIFNFNQLIKQMMNKILLKKRQLHKGSSLNCQQTHLLVQTKVMLV